MATLTATHAIKISGQFQPCCVPVASETRSPTAPAFCPRVRGCPALSDGGLSPTATAVSYVCSLAPEILTLSCLIPRISFHCDRHHSDT
jgi:hypothetical protein